ncbi:MAG: penicillin-binding protein 2 [bacterium]|nr:penicillin-binding protein 2 [bacterium]
MSDRYEAFDTLPDGTAADAPRAGPEFLGRAAHAGRIRVAFTVLAVGVVALFARAVDLQVIRSDAFADAAAQNRLRREIVVPERGIITDRHGVPLVINTPQYALGIVPALLPRGADRGQALGAIAYLLETAPEELLAAVDAFPPHLTEPIAVRSGLAYEDAVTLFAQAGTLPALTLFVEDERVVSAAVDPVQSLAHVLGYLGHITGEEYEEHRAERYRPSDRLGKAGIEAAYETRLRGTPGLRTTTVDAQGRADRTSAIEEARAGETLTLAIDVRMQQAAADALARAVRTAGARRGAAIAMDAHTGGILALVNIPTFDATALSRGLSAAEASAIFQNSDQPLYPRAVAGTYPSGSTIKPFVAAAALSEGVINARTRLLSTGGIRIGQSWFPDWKEGGHGSVDVRGAIAQSVNTFFYLIGGGKPRAGYEGLAAPSQEMALGPEHIAAALRQFGFGAAAGVDVAGEAAGLVPDPTWKQEVRGQEWYIGDTYHLAIGQGDMLVTPLQLAVATAALANGGTRVVPHLVRDIATSAAAPQRVEGITVDAFAAVHAGMRDAVTYGSAAALQTLPFSVYAKTGTAEHRVGRPPHAWTIAFAERVRGGCLRGDACVAVTVLVEEGVEGSRIAVPVVGEMLQSWYRAGGGE